MKKKEFLVTQNEPVQLLKDYLKLALTFEQPAINIGTACI